MRRHEQRYFLWFCSLWLILIAVLAGFSGLWWLLLGVGVAISWFWFGVTPAILVLCLGLITGIRAPRSVPPLERACVASGRVSQVLDTSLQGTVIRFEGHCVSGGKQRVQDKVFLNSSLPLERGQSLVLEVRPPRKSKSFRFLVGRLIRSTLPKGWFIRYRALSQQMIHRMETGNGGFVSAVVLGNRRAVSKGLRKRFARLGLAHLLALSGLHTAVAAFSITWVFMLVIGVFVWQVAPGTDLLRWRNITSFFAAEVVSMMGLCHPASRRAALFSGLGVLFYLFKQRISLLNLVLLSAITATVMFPADTVTLSFAFSYLAVLGLALFAKVKGHWIKRALIATIGASVFTTPLAFFVFHIPAPMSPIANLVFLPLFVPVLSMGMLFTWAAPLLPLSMVQPFAHVIDIVVGSFIQLIKIADHLTLVLDKPVFAIISYAGQILILIFYSGSDHRTLPMRIWQE